MSAADRDPGWFWLASLAIILLMAIGSETVEAQNAANVRAELRATDTVLLKAKRLVFDENCPSQRARDLLIQAKDIQQQAWGAFGNGFHRAALQSTARARDLALEAIKIAQRWQFVKRHIQKTADLIELATDLLAARPHPQAAVLLESAVRQFEGGKQALRSGHIEQAYHLLKNANKLARDIIALLEDQGPGGDRVLHELERTDRLIGKASPFIRESGNEQAQALLDRVLQIQAKAYDLFQQSRYPLAQGLTLQARELVAKAWMLVEDPISPDRVRRDVLATDDLMERVRPLIMESQNQDAIELFQSAGEHQDKAKEALAVEHFQIALAQTKIARRLVDKALQMIEEV
jgi:hypothetical protein